MKKQKMLIVSLALGCVLTACGSGENKSVSEALETKQAEVTEAPTDAETEAQTEAEAEAETTKPAAEEKNKVFSIDDTWTVDGLFTLKVDSVTPTDDRNEFADENPAQVVVITYTYENLGLESEVQDLYITPDRVIDGNRELGYLYPASVKTSPQPTPVGAKMVGAQDAFGLNNESETVTVMFSVYDDEYNEYKASFEVPVTKE